MVLTWDCLFDIAFSVINVVLSGLETELWRFTKIAHMRPLSSCFMMSSSSSRVVLVLSSRHSCTTTHGHFLFFITHGVGHSPASLHLINNPLLIIFLSFTVILNGVHACHLKLLVNAITVNFLQSI